MTRPPLDRQVSFTVSPVLYAKWKREAARKNKTFSAVVRGHLGIDIPQNDDAPRRRRQT